MDCRYESTLCSCTATKESFSKPFMRMNCYWIAYLDNVGMLRLRMNSARLALTMNQRGDTSRIFRRRYLQTRSVQDGRWVASFSSQVRACTRLSRSTSYAISSPAVVLLTHLTT